MHYHVHVYGYMKFLNIPYPACMSCNMTRAARERPSYVKRDSAQSEFNLPNEHMRCASRLNVAVSSGGSVFLNVSCIQKDS
jgi:hypothetical protein